MIMTGTKNKDVNRHGTRSMQGPVGSSESCGNICGSDAAENQSLCDSIYVLRSCGTRTCGALVGAILT